MNIKEIPFYSNLKDNSHCLQACLKMVLKYYFSDKNYSYKFLNKVTFHKKNKWAWDNGIMLFLSKIGFRVVNIENFDYKQFAKFGDRYLKMIWSDEVFNAQKQYSDLIRERKLARRVIKNKSIKLQRRGTNIGELKKFFNNDYLVMVTINPLVLMRQKGYSSHIVLITGIDKKHIIFHDPGLPPLKNKKVTIALFKEAMEYPAKECASLIAVKYNKK